MLMKMARIQMEKCQLAVPAWIMTINNALETLNPTKNVFDVIIIDEASQSDVSALAIAYNSVYNTNHKDIYYCHWRRRRRRRR